MPPRRTVLRGAGWTGLSILLGLGLSGCGIRLEDDAPTIPFLSRQPIPDEALLVAAYRRAVELSAVAARASEVPLGAEVAQRHTRQAQVLRAILDAGQVPERVISGPAGAATGSPPLLPTAAPTAAPTAGTTTGAATAPTGPAAVSADELGRTARGTADASIAAAGAYVTHRALGVAVAAHDAATANILGAPPVWPAGDPLPTSVATPLLEVTRASGYAIQVAASHLLDTERAGLLATIVALSRREAALAAGLTPVPLPTLGYRLPFPVTAPAEARRLVVTVLSNLIDRGLDGIERIPPGSSALIEVVRLEAEAVSLAAGHGVAWPTMPGLALG
jgi:hypothetical protein